MTINELQTCGKLIVTPQDVGPILHMHPQTINLMAKEGTFPVQCLRSGCRTKIPRLKLLEWLGLEDESNEKRV